MTTTKISKRRSGRFRTTMPRAIADELGMHGRDSPRLLLRVQCNGSSVAISITIGPGVDPDHPNAMAPLVHSSGQVELEFPRFQGEAWNLEDVEMDWPEVEDVSGDNAEDRELRCPLVDWEPTHDVDMFSASGGFPHGSSISKSGDQGSNVESAVPIQLAEDVGLDAPQSRAEISFDCVDGRKVAVVTTTDKDREEMPNGVNVHLAGNQQRQARFTAGRVAAELDVYEHLGDGVSAPLRWFKQADGQLVAFIHEEGS